jgi:predicted hotdog family 3-hydroxylacyl-ACP dehydratase
MPRLAPRCKDHTLSLPPDLPERALEQARIRELVPHAGRMCLLERATYWDERRIRCTASSHLEADHPLRREGVLRTAAGIEYAAQAMALHGALLRGEHRAGAGVLLSLRDVRCRVPTLDALPGAIEVEAEQVMSDGANLIYAFAVRAAGEELLSGRATVVLGRAPRDSFSASRG